MHMHRQDARNGTRDMEPGDGNFAREPKRDFGPELAFNLKVLGFHIPAEQAGRERNVNPWTICNRSLSHFLSTGNP